MNNLTMHCIAEAGETTLNATKERKLEIEERIAAISITSDELIFDLNKIKNQIDSAQGRKQATGEIIDKTWLAKAKHAQRMKARTHQQLQVERGVLNKELRKINDFRTTNSLVKSFRKLVSEEIGEERCQILFEMARNNSALEAAT